MCLYTLSCLIVPGNTDNIDQGNITVTNDTEEHQVWIHWPNPTSPNSLIVNYEIELTKVDEYHVGVTVDRCVIVNVTTVWHRWCHRHCHKCGAPVVSSSVTLLCDTGGVIVSVTTV